MSLPVLDLSHWTHQDEPEQLAEKVRPLDERRLSQRATRGRMMDGEQDPYQLVPRPPDVSDYCRLRTETGLGLKTEAAAERGLRGTLFGVKFGFDPTAPRSIGMCRRF